MKRGKMKIISTASLLNKAAHVKKAIPKTSIPSFPIPVRGKHPTKIHDIFSSNQVLRNKNAFLINY
jgi:hypothetical protein